MGASEVQSNFLTGGSERNETMTNDTGCGVQPTKIASTLRKRNGRVFGTAVVAAVLLLCSACSSGSSSPSAENPQNSHAPSSAAATKQKAFGAALTKSPVLPGGGRQVFPDRRFVALYGHPGTPSLGALGEQDIPASIARVKDLAAQYQPYSAEPVVPAFEIIATVAAAEPGPDGNYSNESRVDVLQLWIDAAANAGIYVVLDLQPGRSDFTTQAEMYRALLRRPNVRLALDPELRLGPAQLPLAQIGSVTAAEVNTAGAWLAELTKSANLPQKIFMLHQFRRSMVTEREQLTNFPGLAAVVHADGQGARGDKMATWTALQVGLPTFVRVGWKNFLDEDPQLLTPAETMQQVQPQPWFVSYQ